MGTIRSHAIICKQNREFMIKFVHKKVIRNVRRKVVAMENDTHRRDSVDHNHLLTATNALNVTRQGLDTETEREPKLLESEL